jgi:hypothetical protein
MNRLPAIISIIDTYDIFPFITSIIVTHSSFSYLDDFLPFYLKILFDILKKNYLTVKFAPLCQCNLDSIAQMNIFIDASMIYSEIARGAFFLSRIYYE